MKYIIFLFLFFIPFFYSCEENTCDEKTKALLQIGFYKNSNKKVVLTSIDSLTVYGMNAMDSTLYDNKNLATLFLPLNQNNDKCSFVFNSNDTLDTLTFHYSHNIRFISKECGFASIFNITNIDFTKNKFDSISIINRNIDTENEEDLRIYF